MSRCVLDNEETGAEVVVGWDPGLNTYFAQVIFRGDDEPSLWLGTRPDQFLSPEKLIDVVANVARPFDRGELINELALDKSTNSERIYSIKHSRMRDVLSDDEAYLVSSLLKAIFENAGLSTPVYCPEVKSESDAESMANVLPIIFIWNERKIDRSYTVSINGKYIGIVLAKKVSRTDPSFIRIRDAVLAGLRTFAVEAIHSTCCKLRIMPSIAFAKHPRKIG